MLTGIADAHPVAPDATHQFWRQTLAIADPQVHAIVRGELDRQRSRIELIASEHLASLAVLEAVGSVFTIKYAEGYPGKRNFGGCDFNDKVDTPAIERAKRLHNPIMVLRRNDI